MFSIMMRMSLCFVACVGSANAAMAECSISPFRFFPSQNDSVSASVITDGASCSHRFSAGGTLSFDKASIASRPAHGDLSQQGNFVFVYKPKKGHKGPDSYSIKVCGKSGSGSGCSVITFNASVQ